MGDKVRYGVISTAQIALNQHIPAAREAKKSVITAISSRTDEKAKKAATDHNIPKAYGSYDEILTDPEIDAVINPLPNSMHCEWTIKAAEAGKHILCEKPLAVRPSECRKMIDAAKANNVLLLEAFTQHFSPLLKRMLSLVQDGTIGTLNFLRAELCYTLPDWETDVRGNYDLDGGALFDAGCYCVNVARTIMASEPDEVAAYQKLHERNRVDSMLAGLLKFPGDRIAYISTSMEQPFRFPVEIVGTAGVLSTPNLFQGTDLTIRIDAGITEENLDPVNRFTLQLDHFSEAVLEGKPLRIDPEDGLRNGAVLDALTASAQSGTSIKPKERM